MLHSVILAYVQFMILVKELQKVRILQLKCLCSKTTSPTGMNRTKNQKLQTLVSYICTALEINKYIVHKCIHTVYKCIYTIHTIHTYIYALGKGKSVLLQAWSGPEGSRKLRFPDFMTTAQGGGKVVSHMHRLHLPPGNSPGTHFC